MSYSEQQVSLPGRCKGMPAVYLVENHPLLDGVDHVGKVYVGHMGTDKISVKDSFVLEKKLVCPKGGVLEWKAQGVTAPLVSHESPPPHDASRFIAAGTWRLLISERSQGVSRAKDDVPAIMVTGREHHQSNAQVVKNFNAATQAMLGPRKTRTASSTAFERTRCARKIQKKRCYSIGTAIQLSRRVVAPSASLAQKRKSVRIYQTMVKDLVDATSDMLLNVQAALPDNCLQAFAANSELTGQPGVGKKQVHGTSSIQVNISAAGLSASDNRLGSQLGDFGCENYDGRDSPDHLTTMFANPDIPKDYNSGVFHVLQLGAFVVLNKYIGVTFSGQRRHVGTAPTPPSDDSSAIDESAYRFNVVCWDPSVTKTRQGIESIYPDGLLPPMSKPLERSSSPPVMLGMPGTNSASNAFLATHYMPTEYIQNESNRSGKL
ncbi:hypothetical protein FA13DRAFT_1803476 [Coprinellus micaceus]|uniref:Uncharacterized protein n=1 Tax=Coprinellus micaceus TaxID=71717 RepID=A0A4Y7SA59_COPMI|nr:hypothetical protein FA13DRAFT_1803476 [Coprinellus micaceus]